ncbi:hypothetical protein STBA_18240 [Streptomyces sp. MP131-18]|nr:hypothetical protein STBA_18240 [Streptomyces sp. MP131-18]
MRARRRAVLHHDGDGDFGAIQGITGRPMRRGGSGQGERGPGGVPFGYEPAGAAWTSVRRVA